MANKIIKKLGGDRIGSGNKMTVSAHGYGYSTHDVGTVTRTSMSFGTIVPMAQWHLTTGSRLRMKLDALITSNALLYQLYGSAKFQIDVFSARMALYNPKMLLNLNDQGYEIEDIKFPLMELITNGVSKNMLGILDEQINASSLIRMLGINYNGQNALDATEEVKRQYNAMYLLMYYQTVKEYYCNRQEKIGMMIHNTGINKTVVSVERTVAGSGTGTFINNYEGGAPAGYDLGVNDGIQFFGNSPEPKVEDLIIYIGSTGGAAAYKINEVFTNVTITDLGTTWTINGINNPKAEFIGREVYWWGYNEVLNSLEPQLKEWDLKAVDRMMMKIMANVDVTAPIIIDKTTELPYGASFTSDSNGGKSINTSQEGLALGTYQSDVFNNWIDNATVNNLNARNKIKVDSNGEFSIDMLNITQKLYNYDQRIGVTDGTLDEWREMTYAQVGKSKSLKPVYEGGLSKEIVFDMVISTASTTEEPLGSIASRGQFGSKHKGGYVQIEGDEEKLVMVLAKITPRLVYNQGIDWTANLKTLNDLHKPALDKIGYQNLITDQIHGADTIVNADGTLTTRSAGKQPAWQWYRTNYDRALGNMASTEDYKVFGREYDMIEDIITGQWRIKDLTTYINPMKFNDVFAIKSLDAMNFDVQVGIDATLTLVMSEEVIPNL